MNSPSSSLPFLRETGQQCRMKISHLGTALLLPFAGQRSAALPVVVVECQAHSRSLIDSIDNMRLL